LRICWLKFGFNANGFLLRGGAGGFTLGDLGGAGVFMMDAGVDDKPAVCAFSLGCKRETYLISPSAFIAACTCGRAATRVMYVSSTGHRLISIPTFAVHLNTVNR
jgi:hypothetical protein